MSLIFDTNNRPPSPLRPPPPPVLRINSVCVILASTFIAGHGALALLRPDDEIACIAAACLTPASAAVAFSQFLGTFRRRAGAAKVAASFSSALCMLAILLFLANLAAALTRPATGLPTVAPVLAVLALVAAYAGWTARLNRQWAQRLRQPLPPGTCVYCGYDLRATPHRCPECGPSAPPH